jgi:hypothetical protein
MEKKKYEKPSMKVYEMEVPKIICASDNQWGGYIPTIPGQPEDDKHLA